MGGLGPGIGGFEYLVIAAVALIVIGPERLPGVLRQLGKWVNKMRGMANEFRASFDEMARQSELDELRKEVEALRQGQGPVGQGMVRLGAEADAAFKDIKSELEQPALPAQTPALALDRPEFPEPVMTPLAQPEPVGKPAKSAKPRTTKAKTEAASPKPRAPRKAPTAKPAAQRAARAPRKSKLDL